MLDEGSQVVRRDPDRAQNPHVRQRARRAKLVDVAVDTLSCAATSRTVRNLAAPVQQTDCRTLLEDTDCNLPGRESPVCAQAYEYLHFSIISAASPSVA